MSELYVEQVGVIGAYLDALNAADKKIDGMGMNADLVPLLGRIPVCSEDYLFGFLADELGGLWCFRPATDEEREKFRQEVEEP